MIDDKWLVYTKSRRWSRGWVRLCCCCCLLYCVLCREAGGVEKSGGERRWGDVEEGGGGVKGDPPQQRSTMPPSSGDDGNGTQAWRPKTSATMVSNLESKAKWPHFKLKMYSRYLQFPFPLWILDYLHPEVEVVQLNVRHDRRIIHIIILCTKYITVKC